MVLQENYPSISFITGLWWILKCTSCNKLGYQQTVHIPSLFASTEYVLRLYINHRKVGLQKVQFQISLFCRLTEMHCWFGTGQASQPHFKEKQRAYSIINDDISTLAKKAHLPQSLAYKYPILQERSVSKPRHQSHLLSQPIQKSPHSKSYYKSFCFQDFLYCSYWDSTRQRETTKSSLESNEWPHFRDFDPPLPSFKRFTTWLY